MGKISSEFEKPNCPPSEGGVNSLRGALHTGRPKREGTGL